MRSISEYLINESSYNIEHIERPGDTGMFRINGESFLTYNDDVLLTPTSKTDNTMELCIIYAAQKRQGIATALIKKCVEYAKEKNKDIVTYIDPMSSISEDALIKLLSSFGFEKDEHSDDEHVYRNKIHK